MNKKFTKLIAALALLVFMAPNMAGWGQTTVASFSRSGTSNTTTGGTFTTTFSAKTGYYQDNTGDCYMQILNTNAYWTTTPTSISFAAKIGGGTGNKDLTNPVYVSLLDQNGDVITSTQTSVTSYITSSTGDDYTITIPATNNVFGVKLSHEKESGYNVRYYSFSLSYVAGGNTPTTYTVTYDGNGGSGTMTDSDSPYAAGATVTVLGNEFTRTDYEFDHWNTAADDSGTSYDEDDTFTINANTTLYAQWTENTTPTPGGITAILNIAAYAEDNSWINSTQYTTATVAPVTFTANGGGNTGKYYSSGQDWRFYQNESASITISVLEGFTLVSVTPTYSVSNGGVLKNGNATITSGTTVNVSGTSVTFTVGNSGSATNGQVRFTNIDVTYVSNGGTIPPSISANNVEIAYDAEEGTINYTINNPVEGGSIVASTDAQWLFFDDTPQTDVEGSIDFICAPNSNFYAHSATVTLTYTYGDSKATVTKIVTVTQALDPDASGSTIDYPIMVSEAIDAIDEVGTVSNIYVGGIVSSIFEEYSETYHNITFDMIDEEGNEYFLRAYRCGGDEAANVMVGDEVVVYGNLMLFNNSIYEFSSGCQLVSLMHHGEPAITLSSYSIEATAAETEGTLTVTYTGIEIETSDDVEIYWFEADGTTEATYIHDWILTEIDEDYNVYYVIGANDGAARTAYFKVYGLDSEANGVYSNLVTVSQAAAPQQYTLEVTSISNATIDVFDATNPDETYWEWLFEGVDSTPVLEGTPIALSVVADEGYTIKTLMVNNVDHAADITSGGTYTFNMPAENVTITVTTEEIVAPAGVYYVRITSLDQLTDESKVIIAARYEEGLTNGYYAMQGTTSGKPSGDVFTSETSGDNEILPATITSSEDDYYWTVSVTNDGYTFTNANNQMIGWTSSTNFATGGNNTLWTITRETADEGAMVGEYTGFVIRNFNTDTRAFAFNGSAFGAYATSNMTSATYNFFLDFFVETYTKDIEGNQWYFIASPVGTAPTNMDALSDLYFYDEQDHFWRNKKIDANADGFDFAIGTGYLCANANLETTPDPITLTFIGAPIANEVQEITLSYNETTTENEVNTLAGWNLVGNPFNDNATLDMDCYILSGTAINTTAQTASSYPVGPCEGVMVKANEYGQLVTFTKATPGQTPQPNQLQMTVAQQVVTRNGASTGSATVEDNAIVSFNEGNRLEKFAFNADAAKLYIPQNGKEYAIVSAKAQGEMPVNFRATKNGTYTLTINPEGVEMNYLHLIDNMTGANIDLLQTPSYTFNASMNDYESRFKLVFAAGSSTGSEASETFAFFANGELIVSNEGEATLQVIDINGRILSSERVNGSVSKTINATSGVYMLRLINGENVMVQKIVVR